MRIVSRLSPLAVALVLFSACSEDDPTPPQQTPTLAVSSTSATATVARGSSATYPITIVRGGGYTGQVTLAAVGLPADVQAVFAPQSLPNGTNASTLTLTAGANAPATTTNFTVTASGSGVTMATSSQLSITVTAPPSSITLLAGQTTGTVLQGGTLAVPLALTRTNFPGDIAISVTGLPTGVSFALNPGSPLSGTANATTLTLTALGSAPVTTSPANVTVTASGTGITSQTQTIALSVGASTTPGITLSTSTATASVVAGQAIATPVTVTLARQAGFAGAVNLTVDPPAAGITATLTPTSLTGTALTSSLAISTTAATAPGTYVLTIRGASGTTIASTTVSLTVTAPAGIGVTLGTPALAVTSGGSATSTITLARLGGFTGDVTLTTTGTLPAGLTVALTPTNGIVTGTNTTASVTVNTTAATPAGVYNLTVTGTGAGNIVGTAPLTVTVTAPQAITFTAAAATAAAGSTTSTSAITITRTGGFTGAVTFTLSGLPPGITGLFTTVTTGNTATLTFNVPAGIAPGTYTGTIIASGTGITSATAPITLTVTAAGGGGGNVVARFCDAATLPLWVAVRQGTTGAWTQVTASANNTYNINITGTFGSIAYAHPDGAGGVTVQVNNGTATELGLFAAQECVSSPATKTVTATVTGLSTGQSADISLGGGTGTVTFPNTTVQVTGATDGNADLIAVRYTRDASGLVTTPDRVVIRRSINPAANSTITPVIDFNGSESAPIGSATYTIANAGTPAFMFVSNSFSSTNGGGASFSYGSILASGTTRTVYGIPAGLTQAGDQNFVFVTTADDQAGQSIRIVGQSNRNLANRTITLGAALSAPTVSVAATTPYVRLRATGPIQADYGDAVTATFTQASNPSRSWIILASRAFLGATASTYALEMPDFTGVSGFLNSWGLRTGVEVGWQVTAYSGLLAFAGGFTEDAAFRGASRGGTITP